MTRRASTIPAPLTPVALARAAAVWLGSPAAAAEDPAVRKDVPRAAIAEPPPAYRGAALPLQARDTASLLARAGADIAAGDCDVEVCDEQLGQKTVDALLASSDMKQIEAALVKKMKK